jgi:hypothetical protein
VDSCSEVLFEIYLVVVKNTRKFLVLFGFLKKYLYQQGCTCRPEIPLCRKDSGIESGTIPTLAIAVRHSKSTLLDPQGAEKLPPSSKHGEDR